MPMILWMLCRERTPQRDLRPTDLTNQDENYKVLPSWLRPLSTPNGKGKHEHHEPSSGGGEAADAGPLTTTIAATPVPWRSKTRKHCSNSWTCAGRTWKAKHRYIMQTSGGRSFSVGGIHVWRIEAQIAAYIPTCHSLKAARPTARHRKPCTPQGLVP